MLQDSKILIHHDPVNPDPTRLLPRLYPGAGEAHMQEIKSILGPMRLPFLLLTPACVLLGAASAYASEGGISAFRLALALAGGVAAHISVNALNEVSDFKTGVDLHTERTPFSGGSGTLPARPEKAGAALATGVITLGLAALIGIYFCITTGWNILPLGILGLLLVITYTRWITRSPLLCLVAPGAGFGSMMVMGTDFVLTGQYHWTALVASMVPFFLVSDLLLLNQFPDVEADRKAERRHLPIAIGRRKCTGIYGLFLLGAYVSILLGVVLNLFPVACLLGLATLPIAVFTLKGVVKYAEDIPDLIRYMGMNVVLNLATPVLVAVGLFIG